MFEYGYLLFLFILIPLVLGLFLFEILSLKRKVKIIAGQNNNIVVPHFSEGQKWLKLVFYTVGFALTILAIARPRWGIENISNKTKGRETLILLDVSYSMQANDIIPNRLEGAIRGIREYLAMESGDNIGLMVFTDKSELLVPITPDYSAVNFFLNSIYCGMVGRGGTNIGDALLSGLQVFDDSNTKSKMILLITDGENLTGNFYSTLNKFEKSNIRVFPIGIGTKNGEPIPIMNDKGEITGYRKDKNNKIIVSHLDEKRLLQIAQITKGSYLRSTGRKNQFKNFINSIQSVEKKQNEKTSYKQKKEQYPIFLIPALILFILGFILDQGKIYNFNTKKLKWLFNKKIMIALFLLSAVILSNNNLQAKDASSDNLNQKVKKSWIGNPNGGFWGNLAFKKKNYQGALEKYYSAEKYLTKNELAKLQYNIANSYFMINNLKQALTYYSNALAFVQDNKLKSDIYYNMGLAQFKNKNYQKALNSFKNAIKYNQNNDDARYNYEVCKEIINNQKKKNKNNKDKNKQNKKQMDKMLKALEDKEKDNIKKQKKNSQKNDGGVYW